MEKKAQCLGSADSMLTGGYGSRALSAYWRGAKGENLPIPKSEPDLYLLDGKHYVVLRNNSEILAVYRIQNTGILKRLKRIPKEIGEHCDGI